MSKFDAFGDKFDKLRSKIKEQREESEKSTGGGFDDSWKFKPKLPDNKPKVTYEIRILPNVHTELGQPWIKAFFHMFRRAEDGKFIYTLCPTTFGKDEKCPICEKSKRLFNTNDQLDETRAKELYRKPRYFANVLVVKDPRKGEESQEGQVLVWEFGNQLFDKISDALVEQNLNFYHPFEGHNFNLVIKKKSQYPDYSMSNFCAKPSPIAEDEEEMERVYDEIHDLNDRVYGKGAKDYEKLVEMLTGQNDSDSDDDGEVSPKRSRDTESDADDEDDEEDTFAGLEDDEVENENDSDDDGGDDDDDDFDFDFDDD